MFEIKHRLIHHASHYKSSIDKSLENKIATYDFTVNFRILTIYLPRATLLPTVKSMLLPTVNVLLPTVYEKKMVAVAMRMTMMKKGGGVIKPENGWREENIVNYAGTMQEIPQTNVEK